MAPLMAFVHHVAAAALLGNILDAAAAPVKRNPYTHLETTTYGDAVFGLGNLTYLANLQNPKTTLAGELSAVATADVVPFTVIVTNQSVITQDLLQETVTSYSEGDDVFSEDFLAGIYIISTADVPIVDASAVTYLSGINVSYVFLDTALSDSSDNVSGDFTTAVIPAPPVAALPAGPYVASLKAGSLSLSSVYLLYPDTYRTFRFGAYDSNDGEGSYNPLGLFLPGFPYPMIPCVG